jgi:hypothetical protein
MFPMYTFDKQVKHIYFRIDTDNKYQIIMMPPSTTADDLPERSIIIAGPPSLEKTIHLGSVKPGECVKIAKVNQSHKLLSV